MTDVHPLAVHKPERYLPSAHDVATPAPYMSNEPEPQDDDETFLMLQKLFVAANCRAASTTPQSNLYSRDEILERRRRQRETRRNSLYEGGVHEEASTSMVERRIRSRVVHGSFRLAQVDLMSHDRWALEDPMGRLHPIVTRTKKGRLRSTVDNPKIDVVMTNEHRALQDSVMQNLLTTNGSAAHVLHAPKATWYIRGKDI
ncbi:hypothetical protein SPRG_05451 [Saprolegnia parasitica CBS 223.65]|uniref:Uncharacterized protein n=1 Tax=Saprolegnia parasitica (strain CBS 223.65) TaxID=695850 RepID=A0A067CRY3_SAPPC|nr:hypothetical protein SPRG_05451 [Saprolegnia parasitica CBS 223.65]KDO29271.1 hypothetical protein SPRG_05451 [Saprolegnia parasitica CBS 223.65]|eukprot:XP_012200085.1 hypothetical protein SPRG_05451 [Saprolegnia parasitica CBS 223.65]